ncbi:MAG: hypothetical protein ACYTG0_02130 [Planctomycetota bacterium]|jgi:YHS domain-containing protein
MRRITLFAALLSMAVAALGLSLMADEAEKAGSEQKSCCSQGKACSTEGKACTTETAACSAGKACATAEGGACCAAKKCPVVCPVSGDPISKDVFVTYGGGKVYLRCNGCKAKFEKEPKKFATKANVQLIFTGQAKQKACPFSGRPTNAEATAKVAGIDVAFCCNGCKGRVVKAEPAEQAELCFASKAFEKGFEIKKEKKKKEQESTEQDS